MTYDLEFGLLKTSCGMAKRFEAILKPLNVFPLKENGKTESSVKAICVFYKVGSRVADYYYKLISVVNKSELVKIKREVGIE